MSVCVATAVRPSAMADAETKGHPLQSKATPEAQCFLFLCTTFGGANKEKGGAEEKKGEGEIYSKLVTLKQRFHCAS